MMKFFASKPVILNRFLSPHQLHDVCVVMMLACAYEVYISSLGRKPRNGGRGNSSSGWEGMGRSWILWGCKSCFLVITDIGEEILKVNLQVSCLLIVERDRYKTVSYLSRF